MAKPQLVDANGSILIDGATPAVSSALTIGPGGMLKTLVQDGNYCGPAPAAPVSVAFILSGGGRIVATPSQRPTGRSRPVSAPVPPARSRCILGHLEQPETGSGRPTRRVAGGVAVGSVHTSRLVQREAKPRGISGASRRSSTERGALHNRSGAGSRYCVTSELEPAGCSEAWHRTCFGSTRSWVRIPPPRPPTRRYRHSPARVPRSPSSSRVRERTPIGRVLGSRLPRFACCVGRI